MNIAGYRVKRYNLVGKQAMAYVENSMLQIRDLEWLEAFGNRMLYRAMLEKYKEYGLIEQ